MDTRVKHFLEVGALLQNCIASVTFRDYFCSMDTLTIKLPPQIHRRLAARAKKLNQKKSKLVRDLIERALDGTGQTCHDLMQPGCGHYAGSRESSLKEGFDD